MMSGTNIIESLVPLVVQRPPEVQGMLGQLLDAAIADVNNVDVHDRALFYYRLLQTSVGDARVGGRVAGCLVGVVRLLFPSLPFSLFFGGEREVGVGVKKDCFYLFPCLVSDTWRFVHGQNVVASPKETVARFAEEESPEMVDRYGRLTEIASVGVFSVWRAHHACLPFWSG